VLSKTTLLCQTCRNSVRTYQPCASRQVAERFPTHLIGPALEVLCHNYAGVPNCTVALHLTTTLLETQSLQCQVLCWLSGLHDCAVLVHHVLESQTVLKYLTSTMNRVGSQSEIAGCLFRQQSCSLEVVVTCGCKAFLSKACLMYQDFVSAQSCTG
jgi:hypothetical protein